MLAHEKDEITRKTLESKKNSSAGYAKPSYDTSFDPVRSVLTLPFVTKAADKKPPIKTADNVTDKSAIVTLNTAQRTFLDDGFRENR